MKTREEIITYLLGEAEAYKRSSEFHLSAAGLTDEKGIKYMEQNSKEISSFFAGQSEAFIKCAEYLQQNEH